MSRYVHFTRQSNVQAASASGRWGRVEGEVVHPMAVGPFDDAPEIRGGPWPWANPPAGVTILPPARPTKIICVGRNYAAHAAELGNAVPTEPMLFMKPVSALLGHGQSVIYPQGRSELVHHEGELGVVIGRRCSRCDESEVTDFIMGYTLLNDITARDVQRRDGTFTRGKGFDTFCPVGPWVDTDFQPADQRLTVTITPQGGAPELRQDAPLSQMIASVPQLVAYISQVMTLEPGDLIATGTPAGVGELHPGDSVRIAIEGLGALTHGVA